jgi:hypothetical protein
MKNVVQRVHVAVELFMVNLFDLDDVMMLRE